MKRYIRHIIGPIFFLLIMIGTALFVTSVHFGALTIDILERVSGAKITYGDLSGNVLQGFRIDRYCVKLSETDSVYGAVADIHYRFNPFMLRLPNLFEINLIEPNITIEEKQGAGGRGFRGLPNLRFGLRINLKNGEVLYKNRNLFKVDRISGIIFIDLVGSQTRVATMNLSLESAQHSLHVRSLALDAVIDDEEVRLNSFKLSGVGIALVGSGQYNYQSRSATFDFDKGQVDLKKINKYEGMVDFTGTITYAQGVFLPKVRGSVKGMSPFEEFGFETNAAHDTIWVNLFDGQILGGYLFAQLRITQLKDVEFAMNFKDVDISEFLGTQGPTISSGYLSYVGNDFVGLVSSPHDSGLGLDSVFFFGTYTDSRIRLDSLFVSEGGRRLYAHGAIFPRLDLDVEFSDFDLGRLKIELPVGGVLDGSIKLTGTLRDLLGLSFTSNLSVRNMSVYGVNVDSLAMRSTDFNKDSTERDMAVTLRGLRFKGYHFSQADFRVQDSVFKFVAADDKDSIYVDGLLSTNFRGMVCSLLVSYNQVLTSSVKPIEFDILQRTLGVVNLSVADGSFFFSNVPLGMELTSIDLSRLGTLLGLKDTMSGVLDLSFVDDSIRIDAHNVHFRGLTNGVLEFAGQYSNGRIVVESLHIHDDKNQVFDAKGTLSVEHSELRSRFSNVGVWVLAFLENFLGSPDGLLTGEVSFRGNMNQFEFNGGGKIHDGSFTIDVIAAQFDSVNTDVLFEGDRIIFVSGKGLVSPKNGRMLSSQWVNGGGVVKFEERFRVDNLNFDFSFIDAPLQFPPFAYGIGSGNFSLSMRDRIMYYNGNISVKEAIVPLEFGMRIEEEQTQQDDNWRANVRLVAERNVRLRNRDADIEFGGELSITRDRGPVYLSGVLETDRGNYYWVNHILAITQGKVTFIPGDEIDPDLDFWAELDTREGVKIILHFFGPLSEPIFEFYTDPPGQYTEQDIVTYLNLNITWQELEQLKRGEYMSKIIPRSLLSWLEGDVSRAIRQHTGIDYFHIETPFFEEDEKTKLTLGKFIARNLFVTYTYDITTFSNEFNVEYFIDEKNKIQVERDETGEYNLQYQYRLRF